MMEKETQKWTQAKVKACLPLLHSHAAVYVERNGEVWISGGKGNTPKRRKKAKKGMERR